MTNSSVVYWAMNDYGVTVFDIVINLIILIIAFWIIFLNVILLKTLRDHQSKEATEYYVSSLSCADLLTGIYLLYNTTYNLINFQIITECLLRFGLLIAVSICSVLQLVALSADRCIKIVCPFKYSAISNKVFPGCVIAFTWFLALVIGLLPLMGWMHHPENENTCGFMKILTVGYFKLLVIIHLIPILSFVIIYLRIFKEAHRHAKMINSREPGNTQNTSKHSLRFTMTVLIVVGTYTICWAPMGAVIILHVSGYLDDYTYLEKGNLVVYSTGPAFLNSLFNPIIYALKVPFIRRRFTNLFCKKRTQKVNATSLETVYTNDAKPSQQMILEEA